MTNTDTTTSPLASAAAKLREVAASGVASDDLAQSYRDAALALENMAASPVEIAAGDIVPGMVLRNGFTVIAVRGYELARPGKLAAILVLAMATERMPQGHLETQYATWVATSSFNTYGGDYYRSFTEAVEDFQNRRVY